MHDTGHILQPPSQFERATPDWMRSKIFAKVLHSFKRNDVGIGRGQETQKRRERLVKRDHHRIHAQG